MSEEVKEAVINEAVENQEPAETITETSEITQEEATRAVEAETTETSPSETLFDTPIINGEVNTEGLEALTGTIANIHKSLRPLLVSMTPKQRQHLLKMGPGRMPFVEKTFSYARLNPEFTLPSMDTTQTANQLLVLKSLYLMQRVLRQFERELDNTVLSLGNEVYNIALSYYQSVKAEARRNQPAAEVIYGDLKQHFVHHVPRDPEDQENSDTDVESA